MTTRTLGKEGEDFVAQQLKQKGFIIVAQNYRKFFGEIDIICQKNELVIFVEVKMRSKKTVDTAELIVPSKQRKIGLVAKEFLSTHFLPNVTYRFDVALVEKHNHTFITRYIENAFTITE